MSSLHMEYRLRFTKSDLERDILNGLARQFPESDPQELWEYAEQAMERVRREGNGVLYRGLVRRGVEVAVALERAKSTDSS